MAYNFFDKKSSGAAVTRSRLETLSTQDKSAIKRELCQTNNIQKNHKNQLYENLKNRKYTLFKDNSWSAGLADMQLISKYKKRFRFFLFIIDIFSKDA